MGLMYPKDMFSYMDCGRCPTSSPRFPLYVDEMRFAGQVARNDPVVERGEAGLSNLHR